MRIQDLSLQKRILIALALFGVMGVVSHLSAPPVVPGAPGNALVEQAEAEPVETAPAPEDSEAIIIAQNKIKERLKSPSTADFEMFNGQAVNKGNGHFVVRDHVDSQNGFGAMIRSEYIIELHYTGGEKLDENNWTVDNVVME